MLENIIMINLTQTLMIQDLDGISHVLLKKNARGTTRHILLK